MILGLPASSLPTSVGWIVWCILHVHLPTRKVVLGNSPVKNKYFCRKGTLTLLSHALCLALFSSNQGEHGFLKVMVRALEILARMHLVRVLKEGGSSLSVVLEIPFKKSLLKLRSRVLCRGHFLHWTTRCTKSEHTTRVRTQSVWFCLASPQESRSQNSGFCGSEKKTLQLLTICIRALYQASHHWMSWKPRLSQQSM